MKPHELNEKILPRLKSLFTEVYSLGEPVAQEVVGHQIKRGMEIDPTVGTAAAAKEVQEHICAEIVDLLCKGGYPRYICLTDYIHREVNELSDTVVAQMRCIDLLQKVGVYDSYTNVAQALSQNKDFSEDLTTYTEAILVEHILSLNSRFVEDMATAMYLQTNTNREGYREQSKV